MGARRGLLLAYVVAAAGLGSVCQAGVWGVHVTVTGPEEVWVGQQPTYTANVSYSVDPDTQQEINAGTATVSYEYTWTHESATRIDGGGPTDSWVKIQYGPSAGGPPEKDVCCTVRVTVHYPGGATSSGEDSDCVSVKVLYARVTSVTADKGAICAGAQPSAVHQTTITVTMDDGWGGPCAGRWVTFTIDPHPFHDTPATLSHDGRGTDGNSQATTVLTSPDKEGSVTVRATAETGQTGSVTVTIGVPTGESSPPPPLIIIHEVGGIDLAETLSSNAAAVDLHTLSWTVDRFLKRNGYMVENPTDPVKFGSAAATSNPTDANGVGSGRYTAGTVSGTAYVKCVDTTCWLAAGGHPNWTFEIQVKRANLVSVESTKDSICAGHIDSEPHTCFIRAHVTDGDETPAEGVFVTFEIVQEDHVHEGKEASLSTTEPVEVDAEGYAQVKLISSDKVCEVRVKATVEDDATPEYANVSVVLPESTPDPDKTAVIPLGGSRLLQETLTLDQLAIPGHHVGWWVGEVYDVDGNRLTSPPAGWYGDVDPFITITDAMGVVQTTYTSGTQLGTVIIQAEDSTCHNSSGEHVRLDTFTVVVATLDDLKVENAIRLADSNEYATGIDADGEVIITAVMRPSIPPDAEGYITWIGATPRPGNPMQATLPKTPAGSYPVSAHFGMTQKSVTIHVCQVTGIGQPMGQPCLWVQLAPGYCMMAADPEDEDGIVLQAWLYPWEPFMTYPVPEQLLLWDPNLGGPYQGHAEQRQVDISEPTKYEVEVHCGDSEAALTLYVVGLKMTLDKDSIYVNSDDDNSNNISDLNDQVVDGENDLAHLTIEVLPQEIAGYLQIEGQIQLWCSPGVGLWLFPDKLWPPNPWELLSIPHDLYVEGRSVSAQPNDQWVSLTAWVRPWDGQPYQTLNLTDSVTLTVEPREGDSEAYFKLYRDSGLAQEITANKIGGQVWPVLYVKLGPGCKARDSSTVVSVTDLYPQYFQGTDVDAVLATIDLTNAAGWKVKQGQDWVTATLPPNSDVNKNGSTPILFRYAMSWNTVSVPLGNNGDHELAATPELWFQEWEVGQGWTNDYECGPSALKPECENAFITDCTADPGNIDYFKWDPDAGGAMAAPTITFRIVDADPHKYCGIIRFRQTTGWGTWDWDSGWSSMRFDAQDDMTPEIHLTVADDQGNRLHDQEWGTYTYEILVMEYNSAPVWTQSGALDWNFLKRYRDGYHLWVPEHLPPADPPPPDGTEPGHDAWLYWNGQNADEIRAYFALENSDDVDAQEVALLAVDASLSERSSRGAPTEVGVGHGATLDQYGGFEGLNVYTMVTGDDGTWRVVITAADGSGPGAPTWRTHDAPRMLASNKVLCRKRAYVIVGQGMAHRANWADRIAFWLGSGGAGYDEIRVNTELRSASDPTIERNMRQSGYFHFAGHGVNVGGNSDTEWIQVAGEADIPRHLGRRDYYVGGDHLAVPMGPWCGLLRHAHVQGCTTAVQGAEAIAAHFCHMGARSSAGARDGVRTYLTIAWIDTFYGYATETDAAGKFVRPISGAIEDACEAMQAAWGDEAKGYGLLLRDGDLVPGMKYFGDPSIVIAPR